MISPDVGVTAASRSFACQSRNAIGAVGLWRSRRLRDLLACVSLALASLPGAAEAQTVEILGEFVSPRALSSDGSVVVGRGSEDEAILWKDGELTTISPLSTANDVSADGLVVVGSKGEIPSRQGYRWVDGALTTLPAPAADGEILPLAVNQDGTMIGGRAIFESQVNPQSSQALRWPSLGFVTLPGEDHAGVDDIDATGTIAVGFVSPSFSFGESKAAIWRDAVLTVIGPGGVGSSQSSRAGGISSNGAKAFINLREPLATPRDTFQVYDVETGTKTSAFPGVATSINRDGTVVVGYNDQGLFLWTPGDGIRRLVDVLTEDLLYDLEGWDLGSFFVAVSDDGKWLIGNGKSPEGKFVGWRLTLAPELKIVVNSIADRGLDPDSTGCDTGQTIESGDPECTLRSAIEAVNLGRGDRIEFDVPDVSVPSIALLSALPAITVPVEIDATTQSGGRVEVDGNGLNVVGLDVQGGDSLIQGLILNGFKGKAAAGIKLSKGGKNKVLSNWIGVEGSGNAASEDRIGILIEGSSENEIGGVGPGEGNIIYGQRAAVQVSGAGAEENKIVGNRIGIGNNGSVLTPLALSGIFVGGGKQTEVGGSGAQGNSIAAVIGVLLGTEPGSVEDVSISGNRIGLDFAGTTSSKGFAGIVAFGVEEAQVETVSIVDNKIAGSSIGIFASAQGDFLKSLEIVGNEIGLAFDGSGALPNGFGESEYAYGLRLDGVSGASIRDNLVAAYPWNVLVAGAIQFYVTDEVDEDDDGVPESGGELIFEDPLSSELPEEEEPLADDIDLDGNTIGLNASGEVPSGAEQGVGITIYSLAKNVKISNNIVAGHSMNEIWLKNGEGAEVNDNRIGTRDGTSRGSKVGILIEDAQKAVVGPRNEIARNETAGISVAGTASGMRIHGNFIGTNSGGGLAWPNKVGIHIAEGETENPLLENVIENNTIARNEEGGLVFVGSSIDTKMLSNLIYLNGDSGRLAGIAYESVPFSPPDELFVFEAPADEEGKHTVAFFVGPAGAVAGEGEAEPETIIEIFGNPSPGEAQGRTLLVSEKIDPTKTFLKSFNDVSSDSVYVTSNNYTMKLTRGGVTSEFSVARTSDELEVPEIKVEASGPEEVVISWEAPELKNLFTIEETRELSDGGEWTLRAESLVEVGGRIQVTLALGGEAQFFRLALNPDALGSE